MTNAEKVNNFLNEAGVWYFLTTDGDQPKGRPFRFHLLKNNTLYFGTGTFKKVFQQLKKNPKAEILAVKDDKFLRMDGIVVFEEDDALAKEILNANPQFAKVYNETTGFKLGMFHLENATVEICTMMGQEETFQL